MEWLPHLSMNSSLPPNEDIDWAGQVYKCSGVILLRRLGLILPGEHLKIEHDKV